MWDDPATWREVRYLAERHEEQKQIARQRTAEEASAARHDAEYFGTRTVDPVPYVLPEKYWSLNRMAKKARYRVPQSWKYICPGRWVNAEGRVVRVVPPMDLVPEGFAVEGA